VTAIGSQARPPAVEACPHGQAPGALRLDLLRAFLAVAEELHFTRAAARLFLSQSGLSRRISVLEAILDTPLVVRTTRDVHLTRAGQDFFPYARDMLRAADGAVIALRAGKPEKRRNLGRTHGRS